VQPLLELIERDQDFSIVLPMIPVRMAATLCTKIQIRRQFRAATTERFQ